MSEITKKDVEQVSLLARLELNESEERRYQSELSSILGYIDTISEVATEGVEPTAQVTGLADVTRPDQKVPSKLKREEILENAPEKKDGYIKVKSVLD